MKISTFESVYLQACVGVKFEVVTDKDETQLAVTAPVLPSLSGCSSHPNANVSSLACLVQEPDPNQPKPEGQQMTPLDGENLMVNKWPPSLPAALQRWGTSQPKSPCLTALDNAGKPVYTLTYGRHGLALQKTGPKFPVTKVIMTLFCCPFLFSHSCFLLCVATPVTMYVELCR